jgi:hypothetical protein
LNITCHNQRNKTEAENSWTLQQAAEYNHNQKQHIKASQEETNLQLILSTWPTDMPFFPNRNLQATSNSSYKSKLRTHSSKIKESE